MNTKCELPNTGPYDGAFGYHPLIPESIREIFMWLCQDVASLHDKWHFYLELFTSVDSTRLLSELAPDSFIIVKEALCIDLTVAICRLSDPPLTGKHRNLSFRTLLGECDDIDGTNRMLEDFLAACEPVRQFMHKQMRENDLDITLEPDENPLPGIGRSQVDEILGLADRMLNVICQEYDNSVLIFRPYLTSGADVLLHWLELAKQAEEGVPEDDRDEVGGAEKH